MTKHEANLLAELLDKHCPGKDSPDFHKWVDLVSAVRAMVLWRIGPDRMPAWDHVAYGYQRR